MRHADSYIIIAVHSDNQHNVDYNMQLSMSRAKKLMDYLIRSTSINPQNIEIYGYGNTRPIVPNNLPDSQEKNNRTEITVYYSDKENTDELMVTDEEDDRLTLSRMHLQKINEIIELVQYAALKYDMYYKVNGNRLKSIAKLEADEAEFIARTEAKKWDFEVVKRVVKRENSMYELLAPIKSLHDSNTWKRIYSAWDGKLVEPSELHRGQVVFILYKPY